MKAVTFESKLRPDHTLAVPPSAVDKIPVGEAVQILVLLPEDSEDRAWEQSAAAEFGLGYPDSDAIYDQLSTR